MQMWTMSDYGLRYDHGGGQEFTIGHNQRILETGCPQPGPAAAPLVEIWKAEDNVQVFFLYKTNKFHFTDASLLVSEKIYVRQRSSHALLCLRP